MPKYYFDLTKDGKFHRDNVGDDFVDYEEARQQAQAILPDIVREKLPDGELHKIRCDVRDESGGTVYRGELTYQGTRHPQGS